MSNRLSDWFAFPVMSADWKHLNVGDEFTAFLFVPWMRSDHLILWVADSGKLMGAFFGFFFFEFREEELIPLADPWFIRTDHDAAILETRGFRQAVHNISFRTLRFTTT